MTDQPAEGAPEAAPKRVRAAAKTLTPALEAEILRHRARGFGPHRICKLVGLSHNMVQRFLERPLSQEKTMALAPRLGISKQELRERQKELLISGLEKVTQKAVDFAEHTIDQREARDFNFVMQGLEKLDRVSGNTVGEGTRVIHEGLPTEPPQVQLQVLIQQVLAK